LSVSPEGISPRTRTIPAFRPGDWPEVPAQRDVGEPSRAASRAASRESAYESRSPRVLYAVSAVTRVGEGELDATSPDIADEGGRLVAAARCFQANDHVDTAALPRQLRAPPVGPAQPTAGELVSTLHHQDHADVAVAPLRPARGRRPSPAGVSASRSKARRHADQAPVDRRSSHGWRHIEGRSCIRPGRARFESVRTRGRRLRVPRCRAASLTRTDGANVEHWGAPNWLGGR
jgi:hypothetical protein